MQSTESGAQGRTLPGTTEFDYPGTVTPDGQTLVFFRSSAEMSFDVLIAPLSDPTQATPLVQTPAYEGGGQVSADGKWFAYVSNESGRYEVYVRPLRGSDRRCRCRAMAGSQPVWNPNGQEIFYRIGDRMIAVGVSAVGNELRLAAPQQLFARRYSHGAGITIANYDVTKDWPAVHHGEGRHDCRTPARDPELTPGGGSSTRATALSGQRPSEGRVL